MKHSFSLRLFLPLISFLLLPTAEAASFPLPPRITFWGLGGSDFLGRGDAMAALFGNSEQILWADGQGKYGQEGTWMGSAGVGYRQVYHEARVLGVYGFADYFRSTKGNYFWVASPGIESMGNVWDLRVNGYIPVSSKTKIAGTNFGDNLEMNQFVTFSGHQQFDHLFDLTEEVGAGLDGEVGRTFTALHHLRAYVGGYYFHPKDTSSVQGISGRLEYPIRSHLGIIATDSYDNFAHNTALIGLQVTFGGYSQETYPTEAKERILDPIYRNLGTQSNGTGVPVKQAAQDEGKTILERDHIYFFNANGGSAFNASAGTANCTAESPCNGSSFTQTNANTIYSFDPFTNFYFTPGTYNLSTTTFTLNNGQSMFGRSADYTLPAFGANRALFLGSMNLVGNNRLDSLQLLDSATDTSGTGSGEQVTALTIENASNVVLFNDDITATAAEKENLNGNNFASGIYANNSQVIIKDTSIAANAIVTGNSNDGINIAVGIGSIASNSNANVANDNITLVNSSISSNASIAGSNTNGANLATGIGENSLNGETALFTGNNFTLINSTIISHASVGIINSGISSGGNTGNLAVGIGGNSVLEGDSSFSTNNFTLLNSSVNSLATVGSSNITNDNNFSAGIGGNAASGAANFTENNFTLVNTTVNSDASIGETNNHINFSVGIGANSAKGVIGVSSANFDKNTLAITNSSISSNASIGGANTTNETIGIGGNTSIVTAEAFFTQNTININNSIINTSAVVEGANNSLNQAIGIEMNENGGIGNTVNINQSAINVMAQTVGNNFFINSATGLSARQNSTINISNSVVTVTAQANGTNAAAGTSGGGTFNIFNTLFFVTP